MIIVLSSHGNQTGGGDGGNGGVGDGYDGEGGGELRVWWWMGSGTGKGGGPGCQVTAFIPPGVTNTALLPPRPPSHCQSVVSHSIWHKTRMSDQCHQCNIIVGCKTNVRKHYLLPSVSQGGRVS